MSKINDGGPAFPVVVQPDFQFAEPGMSLRDYFAAHAIAGLIGNSEAVHAGAEPTNSCLFGRNGKGAASAYANSAFLIADAMIAAREAKP